MGIVNKQPKISFQELINKIKEDKKIASIVIGGAAIVLVLIIVLIAVLAKGGKAEDKADKKKGESEVVSENAAPETPAVVDDGSLMENAYEQVNTLVNAYFAALASGDKEAVRGLKNDASDEELIKIEKKSAYINSFDNIKVYTKLGNVDNSYIVFVYYDINFVDVETNAPGLTTIYVCPAEDGSLKIYDGDLDEETSNHIKEVAAQDDVVDLFNRVEVAYNEAVEGDEALKTFMDELPAKLDTEVAEAMAALEAEQAAAEQPAEEAQPADTAAPAQTETVEATDTVNVRASDSENADKLGKLDLGTRVKRLESKENGWSRIEYNGSEGYVKSEYLKVISTESAQTEETASEPESAEGQATSGTVGIKETVNVRESAGEDAKKIGVAYENEHYKLIMKQADGWSKIDFNGKVGYVKSEFVTFE